MKQTVNDSEFEIGQHVEFEIDEVNTETGVVVGYAPNGFIRVKADDDGEIMVGPEWKCYTDMKIYKFTVLTMHNQFDSIVAVYANTRDQAEKKLKAHGFRRCRSSTAYQIDEYSLRFANHVI